MVKKIPIYDYQCKDCKTSASVIANIKDSVDDPECEKCGNAMSRNFNFGAVTFNGPGFYRTDKNKKED
jgi:putative FmdB family regulatory protein